MTVNVNTAETGSNGNTVSTGDTGSPAWSAVSIGTSCTFTYSNTGGCKRDSLCYAYSVSTTSAASYVSWTVNGGGSTSTQYHRLYLDPADFSGAPILARGLDTTEASQRWRLAFSSSTVILRNAANTAVFTSSSLSSGTRYRVEWEVEGTTTGACRLRIYVGESASTFYDSGAGTDNFGGNIQKVRFGQASAGTSVSGKFDDPGWSDTAALGAAVHTSGGTMTVPVTLSGTAMATRFSGGAMTVPVLLAGTGSSSSVGGVTFLQSVFGSNASAFIEAAFGADLTDLTGASWTWTDITSDVMEAGGGVSITLGRQDENSTTSPSSCSFTLLNTSGNYTPYLASGSHYPYIRRGTPIRVRLVFASPSTNDVRFQGYATSFTPGWDDSGHLATVSVQANGILRRLIQGKSPTRTPLVRAILLANPAILRHYWPLDDPANSTSGASVISGDPPMLPAGTVTWAGMDYLNPTAPLTTLAGTTFGTGPVVQLRQGGKLTVTVSGGSPASWTVQFAAFMNPTQDDFAVVMAQWEEGGRVWQVVSDGASANTTRLVVNGTTVCTVSHYFYFNDLIRVDAAQSGGNIAVSFRVYVNDVATNGTISSATLAGITKFIANPASVSLTGDLSIAHVSIWDTNAAPNFKTTTLSVSAWNGYPGETADARLSRLCSEQGVPITITGTSNVTMGLQTTASFIDLLRECEAADGGVLYDGLGAGLGYICRSARYNATSSITFDESGSPPPIAPPFTPVNDDQRIRNDVTVSRDGGSSARYIDANGPLGTDNVGVYDTSVSLNLDDDDTLYQQASWKVHLGTVDGMRYPTLNVNFQSAASSLWQSWLATTVNSALTITNIASVATQMPTDDIRLLIEGWNEFLSPHDWLVTLNCSPYSPWIVAILDNATQGRADTAGSTLNTSVNTTATSWSVATTSGPLWTTAGGDVPFDINCGGEQVRVTAVSGSSSPQTFTVTRSINGVVKAHTTGDDISLWQPAITAL